MGGHVGRMLFSGDAGNKVNARLAEKLINQIKAIAAAYPPPKCRCTFWASLYACFRKGAPAMTGTCDGAQVPRLGSCRLLQGLGEAFQAPGLNAAWSFWMPSQAVKPRAFICVCAFRSHAFLRLFDT